MTDLVASLQSIGLRASRECVLALLADAQKRKLSPTQILEELVELEGREREARNLARRAKMACLGSFKPVADFDWSFPRSIDRELYEHLYESLDFIERGQNILLRGGPGVGKTTLVQNLAHRALSRGYTVRFCTLSAALADLLRQESIPATERRLKRYVAPDLLVLDELGYLPCSAQSADLLFHIVSRRHQSRSLILTTNLAYKAWTTVFPEASCLGALVDRFAQHCHVIDIDGESWRDHERQQRLAQMKARSKPRPPKAVRAGA